MSTYRPVQSVIFDMDGLLLNTEEIYNETFREVLAKYGKTYTNEMKIKVMGTIPQDTYSIFIKHYELPVSLEALTEEITSKLRTSMLKAELMPGAERLVNHLKNNNIPIAVATSSGKESFDLKTNRHKSLFDSFHHIVVGSSDPEVKHGKPAPDIFLVCAARFSEKPSPEKCLVFEDAPNGVEGAIKAGMQVVMVPDSIIPEEKRKLATKVIPSLLDFKPEEFGLPKFEEKRNWQKENEHFYIAELIRCVNFAAIKHKNQRRKDVEATPYINHPIGVANILTEEGGIMDLDVIRAGLLHDTVEDTDTTFEEIKQNFGPKVASIVAEVTDDKNLPKMERKRLQIEKAAGCSFEAKLVKLADKLYNLRDLDHQVPKEWTESRVTEYFTWAKQVVDQLRGTNKDLEAKLDAVFLKHETE